MNRKETVLFIAYHDLATEARSYEMLQALDNEFDDVNCVCRKKPLGELEKKCVYPKTAKNQYLSFIKLSKNRIRELKPDLLVLHDEFTAPLIDYAKRVNPSVYICYDSSELNVGRKLPGLKNNLCKLLYWIERKKIKKTQLVFAANNERAEIMKREYGLNQPVEVFDNIHRIDDLYDERKCKEIYNEYFNKKYTFVYAGGIAHGRYTFDLLNEFKNKDDINLVIVGSASDDCRKEFESIVQKEKITNVFFLGFIPRQDWKYLLENATASFVLFKQDCPNTKYCASGKLYESLFVGTPIVCSTNPPLERLCNESGVGVSTDSFYKGAEMIIENLEQYRENVKRYAELLDYENRIQRLSGCISKHFKGKR